MRTFGKSAQISLELVKILFPPFYWASRRPHDSVLFENPLHKSRFEQQKIAEVYLHKYFQADKDIENSKAIVKLIYTDKWGIKVLGLETYDDMIELIRKAKEDSAASGRSTNMRILQAKAAVDNEKNPRRGSKLPISFNLARHDLGHNYANTLIQPGIAREVAQTEFARPTSSRSSSSW